MEETASGGSSSHPPPAVASSLTAVSGEPQAEASPAPRQLVYDAVEYADLLGELRSKETSPSRFHHTLCLLRSRMLDDISAQSEKLDEPDPKDGPQEDDDDDDWGDIEPGPPPPPLHCILPGELYVSDMFYKMKDLDKEGINTVVCLCGHLGMQFHWHSRKIDMIEVDDLQDSVSDAILPYFVKLVPQIKASRKPVLIHCHAGVSRSPSMCIAYLMATQSLAFGEALWKVLVARRASSPNPRFAKDLIEYEELLLLQVSKKSN